VEEVEPLALGRAPTLSADPAHRVDK
jgi:hypothetical protein